MVLCTQKKLKSDSSVRNKNMASQGNEIRAATRENVARNKFVTSSMQTCRLKDNKAAIEKKLSSFHIIYAAYVQYLIAFWQMYP